MPRLDVINI